MKVIENQYKDIREMLEDIVKEFKFIAKMFRLEHNSFLELSNIASYIKIKNWKKLKQENIEILSKLLKLIIGKHNFNFSNEEVVNFYTNPKTFYKYLKDIDYQNQPEIKKNEEVSNPIEEAEDKNEDIQPPLVQNFTDTPQYQKKGCNIFGILLPIFLVIVSATLIKLSVYVVFSPLTAIIVTAASVFVGIFSLPIIIYNSISIDKKIINDYSKNVQNKNMSSDKIPFFLQKQT